jgi:intergrase/recombinase
VLNMRWFKLFFSEVEPRAGFGPATPALPRPSIASPTVSLLFCDSGNAVFDSRVDWDKYEEWIWKGYRAKSAYDRIQYARRYAHCLLDKNCAELLSMKEDRRAHVMSALSALSKFLGVYEEWTSLRKNYGLKWTVRSDDLIIARFTKTSNPDDLFNWIRQAKKECPDFTEFIDLMLATGLRLEEGVNCYNLIINLSKERKLKDYYDSDREILEHFKFKNVFMRRTKKAFISFIPKELIERISENRKTLTKFAIQSRLKRRTHQVRFGDIRELHGTLLARYLGVAEIDFLHGRVSTGVFMRNYFNPALIGDLQARAIKGIKEIQEKSQRGSL